MTEPLTATDHPQGADLHLGGTAWAHPSLEPRLTDISTVTPYPGNPRRGDQDAITSSIRDLGLYAGCIVQQSTGHVLVGNHRLHALTELGATRVPVDTVDVDDARAAAIVARDNLTSRRGDDDPELLLALLNADLDVLALSGYAEQELDALHRAVADLELTRMNHDGAGVPVGDLSPPIDLDGDIERITVTVKLGRRQDLYALLRDVPWVTNITNPAPLRTDAETSD